ncbi:MAG: PqqD family protein [Bacteroidota bacterium]|nr:PqqD family protein [Bacteroidota bacterium]
MKIFSKKKSEFDNFNLLDLKPVRMFEFEEDQGAKVTLLIPKFRDKILGKYLQPLIKKKYFKVKLDEYGSFVWKQIDGRITVNEIVERLRLKFGAEAEPAVDRVAKFIQHLYRGDCVKFNT